MGKYYRGTHLSLVVVPTSVSHIWKMLKRYGQHAKPHITWHLGAGQIFFWNDCWMGHTSLASIFPHRQHISVRVQDFIEKSGWDFRQLLQALLPVMAEQTVDMLLCVDVPDRIFWKATSDGRFITKSAWQLIYSSRSLQDSFHSLQSPIIPTIVSFFCWRLWQDLIPVDVVIQRRIGSQLVSRCQCCFKIETITHIFTSSDISNRVWQHFGSLFRITIIIGESVRQRFMRW